MEREEQFFILMQELAVFHSVFLALWKMGVPVFTDAIPTAAVRFDESGTCIEFVFNPEFWDSLDDYTRCFVICHECLHVILNHGARMHGCNPMLANYALDIAVNHMLINSFEFDRERVLKWQDFCWVETMFPDEVVPDNKNFEYYYHKLQKGDNPNKGNQKLVDEHHSLPKDVKDIIDTLREMLTEEEIKDLQEGALNSGEVGEPPIAGKASHTFKKKSHIKFSAIWDKILKDIEQKVFYKENPQFVFKNRRMTALNSNFLLPNEYEKEVKIIDKVDILLFLDCSGSCASLKSMFFDLSQTINTKKYNVRLFARTTRVVELTKNENGDFFVPTGIGGSDKFSCIEEFIQRELKAGRLRRYPIVIHVTDGWDCAPVIVNPERPDLWYWFISPTGTTCKIPKTCKHIYRTSDILR